MRECSTASCLRCRRRETLPETATTTPGGFRIAESVVLQSQKDVKVEDTLRRSNDIDHECKKEAGAGGHANFGSQPWHEHPNRREKGRRAIQETLHRGGSARFDFLFLLSSVLGARSLSH